MEPEATAAILSDIPFIQSLPDATRDGLTRIIIGVSNPEAIKAGAVLFTQGEPGTDEGYFVLKGEFEVKKSGAAAAQIPAPELLGEMKQFNPVGLRTATVKAVTPLEVLAFKWADLQNGLEAGLSSDAFQAVEQALESYAWEHFTE